MDEENNQELNPLEEQLEEIKEWQNNSLNPGYFIGTGRVALPVRGIFRKPLFLIFIGLIILLPIIYGIVFNFSSLKEAGFTPLVPSAAMIIIGVGFLYGGIARLINKER